MWSIFIILNSDSGSDCMIADCKEGEEWIVVTDIPSSKRCKLKPEENLHCELMPELLMSINIVLPTVLQYFEENLNKVLDKLNSELALLNTALYRFSF